MEEMVTEAIVLANEPYREQDRMVSFFTKHLGRVQARMVSGMKPTSKLAPHVDVGMYTAIRIFQKHGTVLTDALAYAPAAHRIAPADFSFVWNLIASLLPTKTPDLALWHALHDGLKRGAFDRTMLLQLLGYDPRYATCRRCRATHPTVFLPDEQVFVCTRCAPYARGTKLTLTP